MALSAETIEKMFPQGESAYEPPFRAEADRHGEVHIYDADGSRLLSFCTVTQLPLDDERALAAEVTYWKVEAERLVTALNVAYPQQVKP